MGEKRLENGGKEGEGRDEGGRKNEKKKKRKKKQHKMLFSLGMKVGSTKN